MFHRKNSRFFFLWGKNVLTYAKYFHCSCRAKPLLYKNTIGNSMRLDRSAHLGNCSNLSTNTASIAVLLRLPYSAKDQQLLSKIKIHLSINQSINQSILLFIHGIVSLKSGFLRSRAHSPKKI